MTHDASSSILVASLARADPSPAPNARRASQTGERRQNSLATDVAVRHRRLLVKHRFELTPLFESTINADFRHIVGGGAQARVPPQRHVLDRRRSASRSTAINTGPRRQDRRRRSPTAPMTRPREPSQTQFLDRLNTMPFHGAAYVSLTPWYGKLAAFGQAYVAFDFYFQAGVAFAQLKSNCPTTRLQRHAPGQVARSARMATRSRPTSTRTTTRRSTTAAASGSTSAAASTCS